MEKGKKLNVLNIITGVLFVISFLVSLICKSSTIALIGYGLLSVSAFTKQKNLLIIGLGVLTVSSIITVTQIGWDAYMMPYTISTILSAIGFALSAIVILTTTNKLQQLKSIVNKLWFVPPLLILIGSFLRYRSILLLAHIILTIAITMIILVCIHPDLSIEKIKDTLFNKKVMNGGNPLNYIQPENTSELSEALLNSIRPQLKAPLTAVLCNENELKVSEENGVYTIEGYVNSQNSYGAMISTDFTATANYIDGKWTINRTLIGLKNAKNYAKNFIVAFIAISILTTIGGFLLYLLTTALVG